MKKQVLILGILLLLIIPFVISADDEDASAVDKAYDCLEGKVNETCSTSLSENIFTLLAIGECEDEVIDASSNEECWPKGNCDITTTAQAILALDDAGASTSTAEDWLILQNTTPSDIIWYLEIDSPKETLCDITYNSNTYTVSIYDDKTISSSAGSCLSLSEGDYWLRVSSSCRDEEFKISCDESFITTLLFKKSSSSTIHVSETTHSASAEGTTTEKINSFCFSSDGGNCDYEGTMWAALALNKLGYETSSYIPYLIIFADENSELIPESFLYALTGASDFRADLLAMQKSSSYWDESGDKFYDTAFALYPFQYDDSLSEKKNSQNWLLEIQGNDGCWDNGNIKSTAFILNSLWSKKSISVLDDDEEDCEDLEYYCMPRAECDGTVLDYDCSGLSVCCSVPLTLESCDDEGGEVCDSGEICSGGETLDTEDLSSGETCCVSGRCKQETSSDEEPDCEDSGGICRVSCQDDEEETFSYTCDYKSDSCCIKQTSPASYWWIWLLLVLIILTVVAIIFRDRLKFYWNKYSSKFFKKKTPPSGPGGIPMVSPTLRPSPQRRILPPSQRRFPARRPQRNSEVDEVLKKLKEMGK